MWLCRLFSGCCAWCPTCVSEAGKVFRNVPRNGFGLLGEQGMACAVNVDHGHAVAFLLAQLLCVLRWCEDVLRGLENQYGTQWGRKPFLIATGG